jgi:hypothetical protein
VLRRIRRDDELSSAEGPVPTRPWTESRAGDLSLGLEDRIYKLGRRQPSELCLRHEVQLTVQGLQADLGAYREAPTPRRFAVRELAAHSAILSHLSL